MIAPRQRLPLPAAGLALALTAAAGLLGIAPQLWIAAAVGLGGAAAVVAFPFAGLAVVVFGTQVTGLIETVVPKVGGVALEAVALLVIVGVVANAYQSPRDQRFGPDALPMRLAGLFALVLVISALFADNRAMALVGVQKRFNLLLLLGLIVLMAASVERLRTLVFVFAMATLLSTGLSVFGYATGYRVVVPEPDAREVAPSRTRQVGGASQNATAASRMMLAGAALAAVVALRSPRRRRLYATTAIVGVAGTLLTLSRSTSMVLVVGAIWFLFKMRHHRRLPLILTAAVVVLTVTLISMPPYYWERLSALGSPGDDPTLGRRLGYHLIGLDLLAAHPILGIGPENYQWHYMNFDYRFMPGRFLEPRDLHNLYLSITVETGLLGATVFFSMLLSIFAGLHQARRRLPDSELAVYAEALWFGLGLYLIGSVFGATETNKVLWVLLGLSVATGVLARRIATATDRGRLEVAA